MSRLGTITFQANDRSDIFLIADVSEEGISASDESMLQLEDAQFDSDKAWVTGNVPKMTPVNIAGDNTILQMFYKSEQYVNPLIIRVYIEFEEAEEFVSVEPDHKDNEESNEGYNPEDEGEINL